MAWATVADFESEQINLITTSPGTGREEGKVPTELFYEDDKIMWGYKIPVDGDPIRWFKLLLLKDEDLNAELRSSEFILGESVVDALTFHVVITIPAIWKGYAGQGMEAAAKESGILESRAAGDTTLSFAPEPEAAALSTLSEAGRKPKEGDLFMICDAEGGTVVSGI